MAEAEIADSLSEMEEDLTKPTPEQFGLTPESVAQLSNAGLKSNGRRTKVSMGLGVGIWLAALLYIAYDPTTGFDLGGFLALLFLFGMIPVWLIPVGLIYGVSHLVIPNPPTYKQLAQYETGVARYDAWFVRTQQDFWESLDGRRFEIEVAELFNKAGLKARLTPTTRDQGLDIILGDGRLVQCKAHKVPV